MAKNIVLTQDIRKCTPGLFYFPFSPVWCFARRIRCTYLAKNFQMRPEVMKFSSPIITAKTVRNFVNFVVMYMTYVFVVVPRGDVLAKVTHSISSSHKYLKDRDFTIGLVDCSKTEIPGCNATENFHRATVFR